MGLLGSRGPRLTFDLQSQTPIVNAIAMVLDVGAAIDVFACPRCRAVSPHKDSPCNACALKMHNELHTQCTPRREVTFVTAMTTFTGVVPCDGLPETVAVGSLVVVVVRNFSGAASRSFVPRVTVAGNEVLDVSTISEYYAQRNACAAALNARIESAALARNVPVARFTSVLPPHLARFATEAGQVGHTPPECVADGIVFFTASTFNVRLARAFKYCAVAVKRGKCLVDNNCDFPPSFSTVFPPLSMQYGDEPVLIVYKERVELFSLLGVEVHEVVVLGAFFGPS